MKLLGFIVLCFIWGTTWLAIKFTLEGLPPFFGAALRFVVAAILLLIYVAIRKISLRINRKEFWIIAFSAFLIYALDYGLIYWGEQYLEAGVTAIFFSTFVLCMILFLTITVSFILNYALSNELKRSLQSDSYHALKSIEERISFLAENVQNFSNNTFVVNSLVDPEGRILYL